MSTWNAFVRLGPYVWASYGMIVLGIAVELATLRRRRRAALAALAAAADERALPAVVRR